MESLKILEDKVTLLVGVVKKLKAENALLTEENNRLSEKLETAELAAMEHNETLDKQKQQTKIAVDDLIKNLDTLISNENM